MAAPTNAAPVIIKRKKVTGGAGHHGGAWKVAYADFVTAMMAFFMLMWLLNATTEKQRKGLADYFSPSVPLHRVSGGSDDPFGGESVFADDTLLKDGIGSTEEHATESRVAEGRTGVDPDDEDAAAEAAFSALEEVLKGRGGESLVSDKILQHIVTRVTDEGLVIELFALPGAPLFAAGGDHPTDLLLDLTAMIARVTGRVDNDIAIGGHVRANPVVQIANPVWDLSTARAARVRRLLESAGTRPDRLRRVTGHADRSPALRDPMAVRNDRVEITLLRRGAGGGLRK